MSTRRGFGWTVIAALAIGSAPVALSAQGRPGGSLQEARARSAGAVDKRAELPPPLARLAERAIALERTAVEIRAASLAAADAALAGWMETGLLRLDSQARVQVLVHAAADTSPLVDAVESAGGRVERLVPELGVAQARVPAPALLALAREPSVARIRVPDYAHPQVGSALTEGDTLLNADLVRQLGVDGSGVRIGVISDGVNGLSLAQATGDLPFVDTETCNVVPGSDPRRAGAAEGTAMLEIVHDLAPGAELLFGNFDLGTAFDFNAAVDCLTAVADIVVDDIGFFGVGPYDGTSIVSQNTADALNDPARPVRGHFTSVGNQALGHYQERFADSGATFMETRVHRFAATSTTTDSGLGFPCVAGGDAFCGDTLILPDAGSVRVVLTWNDAWGAAGNDYDLYLLDAQTSDVVASSTLAQDGSQDPAELVDFTNDSGSEKAYAIVVGLFGDGVPRDLDLFVLCRSCTPLPSGADHNFNTLAGSVANQSDSGGGVLSIGTINAQDPGADTVAAFSSRGPTDDARIKPDLTAVDGVRHSSPTGFSNPFFGTSAAAPHAAAVAALLLELSPVLKAGDVGESPSSERQVLRQALLDGAVDLGATGPDNRSGFGRIDALASAEAIGEASGCVESAFDLCLAADRFRVSVSWRDTLGSGNSGVGAAAPLSADTGTFWFFDPANIELVIKVLDARAINGSFWVFYGALSNVEYTITVTDTQTGRVKSYFNPAGEFASRGDTGAFPDAAVLDDERPSAQTVDRLAQHELAELMDPFPPSARRVAAKGTLGPEGSTYEVTLLLGAEVDSEIGVLTIQDGAGDNVVRFDGVSESLLPFALGLGTRPRVTEEVSDLGGGRLGLAIEISSSGGDLCPAGLVVGPEETPLDLCGFALGALDGSDPLDWSPPHRVVSAEVVFSRNDDLRGRFDLTGLGLFGEDQGDGTWDGSFGAVFPGVVGGRVNRIRLELEVEDADGGAVEPFDCQASPTTLCLSDQRFQVKVDWESFDGSTGVGQAVQRTSDTGTFWFFDPANVELVVKVLDARAINGSFWVFYGALSDVEYTITVTDSASGRVKSYTNPAGTFASVGDTGAFPQSRSTETRALAPLTRPTTLVPHRAVLPH